MSLFFELAIIALIYGIVARLVFHRFTNAVLLRRTINRIIAHVLEFRLFIDEPRVVLRAQRDLIIENIRLLRRIALPCLIMAVPFTLLYGPLDRHFGYGPLRVGEPAIVTAPLQSGVKELKAPSGIAVETPGVRVLRTSEISWRVRPLVSSRGNFPRGFKVGYPRATILHLHWIIWFLTISTVAAAMTPSRAKSI